VRSSTKLTPPVIVPWFVSAPQPPPVGGVDLKNVAVKLELGARVLHDDVIPTAFWNAPPFVLHMELSNNETEPPVHGVGAAHAQPLHERLSVASVPAVLRFGNVSGHALLPSFVMQVARPCVPAPPQVWFCPQPPIIGPLPGCARQSRPSVSAPFKADVSAHDAGGLGGVAIAWEASAMLVVSAVHVALLSGTVVVVGIVEQVASFELVTVNDPDAHEPPTPLHEQLHVALAPSPPTTFRSTETEPSGQLGRAVAENETAVQLVGMS
jgi:hypothetical protein